jgi:hypothetical protein
VRFLVASLGDAGVVHYLGHSGASIRMVALHHPSAEARSLMLDVLASGPHALVDAFTLRVLQTGRPVRVTITSASLMRLWVQPEFTLYLDRYEITAMLVVPIRGAAGPVGAVRLWRERPDAAYTERELREVQQLVDHVAASLDTRSDPA